MAVSHWRTVVAKRPPANASVARRTLSSAVVTSAATGAVGFAAMPATAERAERTGRTTDEADEADGAAALAARATPSRAQNLAVRRLRKPQRGQGIPPAVALVARRTAAAARADAATGCTAGRVSVTGAVAG